MSEAQFDALVRLWLHQRYFPWGVFENNKTGYGESYHAPFGGKGGADLVGYLGPLHIEIENKAIKGRLKPEQKLRMDRVNVPWGALYVVCRETGRLNPSGIDEGFIEACKVIEAHYVKHLGADSLKRLRLKDW